MRSPISEDALKLGLAGLDYDESAEIMDGKVRNLRVLTCRTCGLTNYSYDMWAFGRVDRATHFGALKLALDDLCYIEGSCTRVSDKPVYHGETRG